MRCRTGLLAGLEDALAYAKGQPNPGARESVPGEADESPRAPLMSVLFCSTNNS
jgi:hypothetical protein